MRLPPLTKIGVFRALQLGDLLCSIPALRTLRYANVNSEITLIGLPWAASLLNRFPSYIDRFICFPGYPGLPEQPFIPQSFSNFQERMKNEHFDLLLQMQGNGTIVNSFLSEMNARILAGFHNRESFMSSDYFMEYPGHVHEADRHLMLMEFLGMKNQGNHLEFPITAEDHKELLSLDLSLHSRQYVIIHPGSRGSWRQWPPDHFALLANYCYDKGYTIVVTGTKEESHITSELIQYIHAPCINLTGKTSLGSLGALVSDSFLVIANCTGISHIASALNIPSIIISMDGEPDRWRPNDHTFHKVIDWTKKQDIDDVLFQTADLIHHLEMQIIVS
jgi:ADP-heptose:LPS heptosyltransferase